MSLGNSLLRVAQNFRVATTQEFKGHPLATFIRQDLAKAASDLLGTSSKNYKIKASPGQGRWSESPWLAIMDPVVTESPERGYYPVYLFSPNFDMVSLILGQGTYSVRREFKKDGPQVLEFRAKLLRARVPEFSNNFRPGPFPIQSSHHAGGDWSTASAWGTTYNLQNLPSDEKLLADLKAILRTYHLATGRGGIAISNDGDEEGEDLASGDHPQENSNTAPEVEGHLRERLHSRIERRRSGALVAKAKRFHGTKCQGCDFDFELVYGEEGKGYIEAHHLTPLAQLAIDGPVSVDPQTDFAVLCANCQGVS